MGQFLPAETYPVTASDIKQFTIENKNGTKLLLCNYGAALMALHTKDKNGVLADIVLGYESPEEYITDEYYIGTVIGRYANRIAGGDVYINGHQYHLTTKEGGYHHHGGKCGFNKKLFEATPFRTEHNSGVIFTYTSPHLEEGFPGELHFEVIYTLSDDDALTVEYRAVTEMTTLVNFTQHSYFNLSGNPSAKVYDHELKILSRYYLPVNRLQVPTGELRNVQNTVFDFTSFKKIGTDIFKADQQLQLSNGYDHSYVLEKQCNSAQIYAASVWEPASGRIMDVYTTEPAVHFYSGNFLGNIKGKKGVIYHQHSGFCLETQHFPDAPNHPNFPSTILRPGEHFYSKTIFKFSAG